MSPKNIITIIKRLTDFNATLVKLSTKCFCINCKADLEPKEILECDKYNTVFCPICDSNMVVGDYIKPFNISQEDFNLGMYILRG